MNFKTKFVASIEVLEQFNNHGAVVDGGKSVADAKTFKNLVKVKKTDS